MPKAQPRNTSPATATPAATSFATDRATGGIWYWDAPATYHGDISAYYGGTLSFDLFQASTSSQINHEDIFISGGGLTLAFDTAVNPGTNWTSYEVSLSTLSPWQIGNLSGPAATEEQIMTVLADVTDLRIRGEYRNGSDSGGLDNVSLIPEPGFYGALFGLVAMALLIRCRSS